MKKILILGAGIYQVPLINAAKQKGLEVIVASIAGNYPGFKLADNVYYENTTDEEAILQIAMDENIDAICTAGTDVAMKSLGKVVDKMDLIGPNYHAAKASSDKLVMKNLFEKHQVRTARFREVNSLEKSYEAFELLNKPVVFKVLDSSGSRGVIKVEEKSEIEQVYNEIMGQTRAKAFIIEEFIDGIEFGVQSFISEGKVLFNLPHGDMLHIGKTTVPIGHYVPFELDLPMLDVEMEAAIKSLGMDNCAINADLIIKDGDIYFLELAARSGATCLPEIVSLFYGMDYYSLIIDASLGVKLDLSFTGTQPCGAEVLTSDVSGELISIEADDNKPDYLIDISFDYQPGDEIRKFHVGPDRIGQIVVKGDNLEEVHKNLTKIKNNISIKVA